MSPHVGYTGMLYVNLWSVAKSVPGLWRKLADRETILYAIFIQTRATVVAYKDLRLNLRSNSQYIQADVR